MKQKGFVLLPILIVVLVIGAIGYFAFQNTRLKSKQTLTPTQSISPTTSIQELSPTANVINIGNPTSSPSANGANLREIRYSIPNTWKSEIRDESLFLSPESGGGYLVIKVYSYPKGVDVKKHYCDTVKYCIDSTYFTDRKIGNISSGYEANALDNSGGGTDYLGVKGNKFYIISSYSPPPPNEFDNNRQSVLNSLIF